MYGANPYGGFYYGQAFNGPPAAPGSIASCGGGRLQEGPPSVPYILPPFSSARMNAALARDAAAFEGQRSRLDALFSSRLGGIRNPQLNIEDDY